MTNHACIVVQGHGVSEIDSGQLCVNDGASAVLLVIGFGCVDFKAGNIR